MTVTCRGFTATPLPDGEIRLDIESVREEPLSEPMTLQHVAKFLGKSVKSVDRLSRRKKDPLPVHRGKGRPFVLPFELQTWMQTDPTLKIMMQESTCLDKEILAKAAVFGLGATRRRFAREVASTL